MGCGRAYLICYKRQERCPARYLEQAVAGDPLDHWRQLSCKWPAVPWPRNREQLKSSGRRERRNGRHFNATMYGHGRGNEGNTAEDSRRGERLMAG